jgi:hypothetical protein
LLWRAGRLDEALAACEHALAFREPLVDAHPEVPTYREGRCGTFVRLGQVRRDMQNLAAAAAAWDRTSAPHDESSSPTGAHLFLLACCHAGLVELAGRRGSGVSAMEGADKAEESMDLLRQAVAIGFRYLEPYRRESALDPLRGRDDFRLLMMDVAMPANAFMSGDSQ